ncbi:hypothetical protein [Sphingomonas sp.]|jgi:hypothetical protein|uniref:hypothetical protein n=1 Tax=Sphingomonas sp. TaxID=28214 RepID=UPI002E346227|nr:hypothetical protein [Sphingomonas sp.]HEX4693325.1 hypothetical protein [Sphingomonas sp.]
MFSVVIATALAAASAVCHSVPGAEQLWGTEIRWVFVGELHGTNEIPDAFVNLACLAAQQKQPVTVALEYPVDEQPWIDAFLVSDGGAKARAALLAAPFWHRDFQDGRSSVAFLRMFERLRAMKHRGLIAGVRCFDVSDSSPDRRERNAAMADRLVAIQAETRSRIMVLVGNFHASRSSIARAGRIIRPAASLMPRDQTITVNVIGNGGTAWDCEQEGCGPHSSGPDRDARRGIVLETDPAARWDVTYELGRRTTAAVPAVPLMKASPSRLKEEF